MYKHQILSFRTLFYFSILQQIIVRSIRLAPTVDAGVSCLYYFKITYIFVNCFCDGLKVL